MLSRMLRYGDSHLKRLQRKCQSTLQIAADLFELDDSTLFKRVQRSVELAPHSVTPSMVGLQHTVDFCKLPFQRFDATLTHRNALLYNRHNISAKQRLLNRVSEAYKSLGQHFDRAIHAFYIVFCSFPRSIELQQALTYRQTKTNQSCGT